jgi:hypothetical protein
LAAWKVGSADFNLETAFARNIFVRCKMTSLAVKQTNFNDFHFTFLHLAYGFSPFFIQRIIPLRKPYHAT